VDVLWVEKDGAIHTTFWDERINNGNWVSVFSITPTNVAQVNSSVAAVSRTSDHIDVLLGRYRWINSIDFLERSKYKLAMGKHFLDCTIELGTISFIHHRGLPVNPLMLMCFGRVTMDRS